MSGGGKGAFWGGSVVLLLLAAVVGGAELPPEIEVDRLLVRAERQAQEGGHGAALATLNEVLALVEEQGLAAPDAFWFRHAQAASAAGAHAEAVESARRYLTTAGRAGAHYRAALELLETSDREVQQALREREARARVERARRQAEAFAEAAYGELRRTAALAPAGVGEVFTDALRSGGRGPAMVTIPAGAFRMGCLANDDDCFDDDQPVHEVTIGRPFALSVYEVTFAEWDACAAAAGCDGYPWDEGWGRGSRPVINLSWDDAGAYAAWLSAQTGAAYRLPSEAEWEYAARAGTATKYSWGNEIGVNRANCGGCGSQWDYGRTAPAGSFRPNAFGLYDMHGNVWEWVADCWNGSYAGTPPTDGSAWLQGECSRARVARRLLDQSARGSFAPRTATGIASVNRFNNVGFRVARTLTP